MKLLAIESSAEMLSLAVFEDGVFELELSEKAAMRQNESLAPLVEKILRESGWKASDLNAVAVSLGPGSFTGLRTGLAFAKGLCFATGALMIGVPTLEAWADGTAQAEVWLDARRGMVYRGVYEGGASLAEPRMLPLEEAKAELRPGFTILGDIAEPKGSASAIRVGRLALKRLAKGDTDPADAIEPIYLRRPEAEILWEKHHPGKPDGRLAT